MSALQGLERDWYVHSARKLIAERGAEAAQRVADFQRSEPTGFAFYADIIEAELSRQEAA